MKTTRTTLAAALAALTLAAPALDAQSGIAELRVDLEARTPSVLPLVVPPPAQEVSDTVDVLYARARELMIDGSHRRAAEIFRALASDYPESEYAADAYYWEAFNLYRLDSEASLRRAAEALRLQSERYPNASSLRNGEAPSLMARLSGQLASLGDVEAAEQVRQAARQEACGEEDLETRMAALNALVRIGPEEALPILRDVIARQDACGRELRRRVPYLLGRFESDEATQLLIELARSDSDVETRQRAIQYLGRSGSPEARNLLMDIARSEEALEAREQAVAALGRSSAEFRVIESRQGGVMEMIEGRVRGSAVRGVVVSGRGAAGGQVEHDPAVEALFMELATDPSTPLELREDAIVQLGRGGGEAVIETLDPIFRSTPELREAIVDAVRRSGDPGTAAWLMGVAGNASVDLDVREDAIYRAGLETEDLAAFRAIYPQLDETDLKQAYLRALGARDEETAAVDEIIRVARTETDPEARRSAILYLGRSDDPRVAAVLREIIGGG